MPKSIYRIQTTSGGEVSYTLKEMIDICSQYLKKQGSILPTKDDCINEIDHFVSTFKLIDDNKKETEN